MQKFIHNALGKSISILTALAMVFGTFATVLLAPQTVLAADSVFSQANPVSVSEGSPKTFSIDATGYENLKLSFDYDSSALDSGSEGDSFTYGYEMSGGDQTDLGTVQGTNGTTTTSDTVSSVSIASTTDGIYFTVTSGNNVAADVVEISNLTVTGDKVDTTAPTVSVTPTPKTLSGEVTFHIEINDANPKSDENKSVWVYLYNTDDGSKKHGEKVDLSSGEGNFTVDTTGLPDGDYTLDVGIVEDAAGNPSGQKDNYFSGYSIQNEPGNPGQGGDAESYSLDSFCDAGNGGQVELEDFQVNEGTVITTLTSGYFDITKVDDGTHHGYKVALTENSSSSIQYVKGTITLPSSAVGSTTAISDVSGDDGIENSKHDDEVTVSSDGSTVTFDIANNVADDIFYIDFETDCGGQTPDEPQVCEAGTMYHLSADGGTEGILYSVDTSGNLGVVHNFNNEFYSSIASDGSGHLYSIDKSTGELVILGTNGVIQSVGMTTGITHGVGMTFNRAGNLYVVDQDNSHFYQIDPTDGSTTDLGTIGGIDIYGGDLVSLPNSDHVLYVSATGEVYEVDVANETATLKGDITASGVDEEISSAMREGLTYYALNETNNQFITFTLDGSNSPVVTSHPENVDDYHNGDGTACQPEFDIHEQPKQICEAPGVLFLDPAQSGPGTTLYSVDTTSGDTSSIYNYNEKYESLAVDAGDTVYSLAGSGDLVTLNDDGTVTNTGTTISGLDDTVGMAFNRAGLLYVIDQQDDQVFEVNVSAGTSTVLGGLSGGLPINGGDLASRQASDNLIYVAPDGDVYEVNPGSETAHKLGTLSNVTHITSLARVGDTFYALDNDGTGNNTDGTHYSFKIDAGGSVTNVQIVDDAGPFQYGDGGSCSLDFIEDEPDESQMCVAPDQRWADSVADFNQGDDVNGDDVASARSDQSEALGPEDPSDDAIDYVSLGFGGSIALEFDEVIPDVSGDDIRIYETSYDDPSFSSHPEKADVYVSADGTNFTNIGTVKLDGMVDINGAVSNVRYIKIVDTSDKTKFGNGAHVDGFDVAGVEALGCGKNDAGGDDSDGTITGMKFEDEDQNGVMNGSEDGLEGWTIIAKPTDLVPVETLTIDSQDEDGATTTHALTAGDRYLVEVEGTYVFDNTNGREADAEYYTTNNFTSRADWAQDNPGEDSRTLDLIVDSNQVNWGPYNADDGHTYTLAFTSDGTPVNFRIFERQSDHYDDNAGSLEVRVYNVTGYATTTDASGDYSFMVDPGDYRVLEVRQSGWVQTTPKNPHYYDVTVSEGENATGKDFGNDDLDDEQTECIENCGGDGGNGDGGNGGGGGGILDPVDHDDNPSSGNGDDGDGDVLADRAGFGKVFTPFAMLGQGGTEDGEVLGAGNFPGLPATGDGSTSGGSNKGWAFGALLGLALIGGGIHAQQKTKQKVS